MPAVRGQRPGHEGPGADSGQPCPQGPVGPLSLPPQSLPTHCYRPTQAGLDSPTLLPGMKYCSLAGEENRNAVMLGGLCRTSPGPSPMAQLKAPRNEAEVPNQGSRAHLPSPSGEDLHRAQMFLAQADGGGSSVPIKRLR